jgi:rubredoxin
MNTHAFLRIFMPGGILTHDALVDVVKLARQCGAANVQFGLRQDINIAVERFRLDDLKLQLKKLHFDFEFDTNWSRNIVTSYAANGIFPSESWMTEGTYLGILDDFDFKPKLRINIVDPNQGLVPLLTGNLNFIASKINNYWYLKMDLPQWFSEISNWPSLIYSDDISKVAKNIEAFYTSKVSYTLNDLFTSINQVIHGNSRRLEQELSLPAVRLPYYEGFNKSGDRYWLGIYKRNYLYSVDFLEAVADLCYLNHLNKICLTPWRSFLIKDIREAHYTSWVKLLGKFGINMRHSSLELNWRVPDFDAAALELKMYLVSEFDKNDIRTYGLTFAIRTKEVDLDAIIVIEKVPTKSMFKTRHESAVYNIYHSKDFEPNQKEYIHYQDGVSYSALPKVLQQLTNGFYEQQSAPNEAEKLLSANAKKDRHQVYQCKHCFTTYDQEYGDSINCIAAGTTFVSLSDAFRCSVCDAPKADFLPVALAGKSTLV